MKEEEYRNAMITEQFIGIFPNAIDDNMCAEFVKFFDMSSNQGFTMSSVFDGNNSINSRNDEVIHIPASFNATLSDTCFPSEMLQKFWSKLAGRFNEYRIKYTIEQSMSSFNFKMHRVRPSGGYHEWHQEQHYVVPERTLAWMVVVEAPESGGETEFLHQSLRVEPKVGQLTLWPAGFTHKHRGNPPLKGQKTYITGWFQMLPGLSEMGGRKSASQEQQ
jgi:hypothetical protein